MGCVVSRRQNHNSSNYNSCTVDFACANYDHDFRKKCANYIICKDTVPESDNGLQDRLLCMMCDQMLGKLSIRKPSPASECCICLDDNRAFEIKMDCGQEHWVCQDCFSKPLQTDYFVLTKKTIMISFLRLGWKKTVQLVNMMPCTLGQQREVIRARICSLLRCPLCRGKSPWGRFSNHHYDDDADLNIEPILLYNNKKMMRHLLVLYREVTSSKTDSHEIQEMGVEMQAMWSPA